MKVRTRFVSNSSSSSFILGFKPEQLESKQTLKAALFKKDEGNCSYYDYVVPIDTIVDIVWSDITGRYKTQIENNEKVIQAEIDEGYLLSYAKYTIKDLKDLELYLVEYSDNDGETYCVMEHGDIFSRIPHIRISKH